MPDATHETPWTTVDIVDQFQRFVRKPELEADATWVPATAVEALRAEVATLREQHQETCICAAVKTEEGQVIRGHRHHDAMHAAGMAFCRPLRGEEGQGFVTSRGRFVDRREGRKLQEAAGIGSCAPGGYRGDLLFSEDLY